MSLDSLFLGALTCHNSLCLSRSLANNSCVKRRKKREEEKRALNCRRRQPLFRTDVCVCARAADCRVRGGSAETPWIGQTEGESAMANGERERELKLLLLSEGSHSLASSSRGRRRRGLHWPDGGTLTVEASRARCHLPSSRVRLRGRGLALPADASAAGRLVEGRKPTSSCPPARALHRSPSSLTLGFRYRGQSVYRFRTLVRLF